MRWPWQKKAEEAEEIALPEPNPAKQLCEAILLQALKHQAETISFVTRGDVVEVVFDGPGDPIESFEVPARFFSKVVNIFKLMARLELKAPPQTGRIALLADQELVGTFEVQTFKTEGGSESLSLRVLR